MEEIERKEKENNENQDIYSIIRDNKKKHNYFFHYSIWTNFYNTNTCRNQ
ncbi:hypothetical protein [Methanobrevibacter arboriphilus]|nr:hypothetical protein [Methanobrevibacter arboriphilus]